MISFNLLNALAFSSRQTDSFPLLRFIHSFHFYSVSYLNINTINRNTNINVVYMCSFFLVVDLYYFIITKGSNKFLFSKRNSINTIRFLLCWVFCFALLLLLLLCLFGIKKIPINWYIFVDFRKL